MVARFTASSKENKKPPTTLLTITLVISFANLISVGVLFYLHSKKDKTSNTGNIVNLVMHVMLLLFISLTYLLEHNKFSQVAKVSMIISLVSFLISMPFTLFHLLKGSNFFKKPRPKVVQETLQPNVNQVKPTGFDAEQLLSQFQKVSNRDIQSQYRPRPVQPRPVQPRPVQSPPVQPQPVQSQPVQPQPVQPQPVQYRPVKPSYNKNRSIFSQYQY